MLGPTVLINILFFLLRFMSDPPSWPAGHSGQPVYFPTESQTVLTSVSQTA